MEILLVLGFFILLFGVPAYFSYLLLVQNLESYQSELEEQGLSEAEVEEKLSEIQAQIWEIRFPEL